MTGLVAVHLGAGYHSPDRRAEYQEAINNACQQAVSALKCGGQAAEAVAVAVAALEDSPCTNAGLGSNLTLEGSVECDAGIMDGRTMNFGAVGALAGVQNPVKVAGALLQEQEKGLMSCGRIPPCLLVGNGARHWARDHGFKEVNVSRLITPRALSAYRKHKRALDEFSSATQDQHQAVSKRMRGDGVDGTCMQDTVGAVCVDNEGHVASAVSSGGIALKHPGRLGHAVMFGCGCWAQSHTQSSPSVSVACSTSGSGEQLMRCCLAKACCERALHSEDPTSALGDTFKHQFLKSQLLADASARLGGAVTVKYDHADKEAEILWTHSTHSMCVGYMDTSRTKAKMVMSRLPPGTEPGATYTLGGATLHLSSQEEPPS